MSDNTSTMENALDVETRDTNMQGDTQDWQDNIEWSCLIVGMYRTGTGAQWLNFVYYWYEHHADYM